MREKGQSLAEMILVVGFVSTAVICSIYFIGGGIQSIFHDVSSNLEIVKISTSPTPMKKSIQSEEEDTFCECEELENDTPVEVTGSTQG